MAKKFAEMGKIDFVLLWVDDSDPVWQESYRQYSKIELGEARDVCYRDWGTLRYWFRGVEKFAPWVNKVFFVTCGHYPDWLNLNCSKLSFVKHSDFIPADYLPTFSSHAIELNLHRIPELSERFVYFNDDTFIINHIPKTRFFKDELPCDMAVLNALQPIGGFFDHIKANNIAFVNSLFNKKEVLRNNLSKWFSPVYESALLRTFALLMYPLFTGLYDPHQPNPYLKNTFEKVWELSEITLHKTCLHRFRSLEDVNQYVFRYYQIMKGEFHPINIMRTSEAFPIGNNLSLVTKKIMMQSKPLLCINDSDIVNFHDAKEKLISAFEAILPDKSMFEL